MCFLRRQTRTRNCVPDYTGRKLHSERHARFERLERSPSTSLHSSFQATAMSGYARHVSVRKEIANQVGTMKVACTLERVAHINLSSVIRVQNHAALWAIGLLLGHNHSCHSSDPSRDSVVVRRTGIATGGTSPTHTREVLDNPQRLAAMQRRGGWILACTLCKRIDRNYRGT